jgi:hypothetical protein
MLLTQQELCGSRKIQNPSSKLQTSSKFPSTKYSPEAHPQPVWNFELGICVGVGDTEFGTLPSLWLDGARLNDRAIRQHA